MLTEPQRPDWPQWRGPEGSGVADGHDLPTTWGRDSSNVLWRTQIRGRGYSSPIVSGERVFVTSAYDAPESHALADLGGGAGALLAAALFLTAALRSRGGPRNGPPGRQVSGLERCAGVAAGCAWVLVVLGSIGALTNDFEWLMGGSLDLAPRHALLVGLAAAALVCEAAALARGAGGRVGSVLAVAAAGAAAAVLSMDLPQRYAFFAALLLLFFAVLSARSAPSGDPMAHEGGAAADLDGSLGRYAALAAMGLCLAAAAFPQYFWTEATGQHVWARSAMLVVLGLIGAVSCAPQGSRLRLVGAAVLFASALALAAFMPPDELDIPPSPKLRAFATVPAVLATLWFVLRFARSRSPAATGDGRARALGAAALVLASGWTFVRANVLQPRIRTNQAVICLDRRSGDLLWRRQVFTVSAAFLETFRTSHAMPTPACDGSSVVAHFGNGTVCLDLEGRVRWSVEDPDFVGDAIYGAGSSPVIAGDTTFLVQEHEHEHRGARGYIAALATSSGELRWRVEPATSMKSYGTPLVRPWGPGSQLVTATWHGLVGYDTQSGARLWSHELPIEEVVTSLVGEGRRVFVAGGSMRGLTAAVEIPLAPGESARTLWSTRRGSPSCSSPVLYEGRLFTVGEGGLLTCFAAQSGEVLWRERLEPGQYYASLAAGDGKLYASSDEGVTTVVAASGAFEELARNELGEQLIASPALAGGRLFLRGDSSLTSID